MFQDYLNDPTPSVRAMAIQAIRYTLPDSDKEFDNVLKTTLLDMVTTMLADKDLENQRLALTTLNSAAHNKRDLIIPNLGNLLPLIMEASVIKPELIRVITMGPFKHKVDDGLEIRKVRLFSWYCYYQPANNDAERLRDSLFLDGDRIFTNQYFRFL